MVKRPWICLNELRNVLIFVNCIFIISICICISTCVFSIRASQTIEVNDSGKIEESCQTHVTPPGRKEEIFANIKPSSKALEFCLQISFEFTCGLVLNSVHRLVNTYMMNYWRLKNQSERFDTWPIKSTQDSFVFFFFFFLFSASTCLLCFSFSVTTLSLM